MTHPAQDALASMPHDSEVSSNPSLWYPWFKKHEAAIKQALQSASREWMDIIDMPTDEVCLVSGHSEGNPKRERWYVTGIKVCGSIVSEDGREGLSYADKFQFIDKIPTPPKQENERG